MRTALRISLDKVFTCLTGLSIVFMALVLLVILGPMIYRGSSAVFFQGTVEFRKMQHDLFARGNDAKLQLQIQQTDQVRDHAYQLVASFKQGLDTDALCDRAKLIYRQLGQELEIRNLPADQFNELRTKSRTIRKLLEKAFTCKDKAIIDQNIQTVMQYKADGTFNDTAAAQFFVLAEEFARDAESIDFDKAQQYNDQIAAVEDALTRMLGPAPNTPKPVLVMNQYGATRWDTAQKALDDLMWYYEWVQQEPGKPLVQIRTPRKEIFASTKLEPLFDYTSQNMPAMLEPKTTIYWQYFIDPSTDGHYFGGVGPEIIGTLILTALSMLFVIPLGVISAAYLVECAPDNIATKILRMCINSLAGVPSIVFGLFGLAFFVLYFLPLIGAPSKPCVLAASMTLALLTLPVMIRASEEAIKTVPSTYKEASLGLGASRFRTFISVTLPAALPGILTGVILSLSRVAGETAPILFTGAVALGSVPNSLFDPTKTLSYGSYDIAVSDRIAMMVPYNQYGMVITLVLLIICLNAMAIVLRIRVFKKLKGH